MRSTVLNSGALKCKASPFFLLFVCLSLNLSAQLDRCSLTWQRINPPNTPDLLLGQATAYDSRRQVAVLFGGSNPLTGVRPTSDTWEWNGASWTKRNSGQAPARSDAAMVYDSDRGVCGPFGGGTNSFQSEIPFNDTWEWDGATWTLRQANNASATDQPPPLDYPIMVYDSFRKRIVLSGSTERVGGEINPVTRTWEWDGSSWSVYSNAPPPRYRSAMAFDSARRVTVWFGGTPHTAGDALSATWTWDGITWKIAATSGPAPRSEHAMAFDVHRKVLVMFGGYDGDILAPMYDTHEWNGTSWTYIPNANTLGLTGRRLHKMWDETGAQRLMVFGGTVSFRSADGVFSHQIYDTIYEARPPGLWVDFSYPGQPSEDGFFYTPFNTLAEAVNVARDGCAINLKAGSRAEAITITKALRLEAFYGPVTIGQ